MREVFRYDDWLGTYIYAFLTRFKLHILWGGVKLNVVHFSTIPSIN